MLNNTCLSCSEYISECTSCKQVDNSLVCTACNPGNYLLQGSKCLACIDYCLTCNGKTGCTKCQDYFYYDGKACSACPQSNCKSCNGKGKCLDCGDGTYLQTSSGTCEACDVGCESCSSATQCIVCESGYYSFNSGCLPCSPECTDCVTAPNICRGCIAGYYQTASYT